MLKILHFLILFSLTPLSYAAQNATITANDAHIYSLPSEDSESLATLEANAKVRISSNSKKGWYKISIPGEKLRFGWIKQEFIALQQEDSNLQSADLEFRHQSEHGSREKKENEYFVKLMGAFHWLFPSQIMSSLGEGSGTATTGLGSFLEGAYRFDTRTKFALRLGSYTTTKSTNYNGLGYKVELSGIPFLLGLERAMAQSESFSFSVGLYGGAGFFNKAKVTSTDSQIPNSFELKGTSFAFQIDGVVRYWLSNHIALGSELGFYYSRVPSTQIGGNGFNGDFPFRNSDGSLKSLFVNHLGPYLALSIEYGF